MNGHANQPNDESGRYNRAKNRGQCKRQCSDAARSLSPHMKGIHEPHRSRKKNNPRTEEFIDVQ